MKVETVAAHSSQLRIAAGEEQQHEATRKAERQNRVGREERKWGDRGGKKKTAHRVGGGGAGGGCVGGGLRVNETMALSGSQTE